MRLPGWLSLADPPDRFWTSRRATAFNLTQICCWFTLAELRLPLYGHFLEDEAKFYQRAVEVARGHRLAADGVYISGTNPVVFTPGGAFFDLIAPPFLWARDPRWGVAWLVLLSAAGMWLLDRALDREGATGRMRVIAVTLATWTIWHARFADRLWAAHLFLFATPLLLWLSSRLAAATRRWPWAIAWGAAAGVLLQLHLSGAVPIALCGIVALRGSQKPPWRALAAAAAAGALAVYLPWIWSQLPVGFAGLAALRRGRPAGLTPGLASGRALAVFFKFSSQSSYWTPERWPAGGTWPAALGFGSFWIGIPLTVLGFGVRGRWRAACVSGLLLVPLFLASTGRAYYDHYVIASFPFFVLPAAAALSLIAGSGRKGTALAAAYLAGFVALGCALFWREYSPNGSGWTTGMQLEITQRLLDRGGVIAPEGESLLSEQPRIYQVLASEVLQRDLAFTSDGDSCYLGPAPQERTGYEEWPIGGGRGWLGCKALPR